MKYESIAVANESLARASEMLARELTAAAEAGYEVDGQTLHHYDPAYEKHTLVRFIYKPQPEPASR